MSTWRGLCFPHRCVVWEGFSTGSSGSSNRCLHCGCSPIAGKAGEVGSFPCRVRYNMQAANSLQALEGKGQGEEKQSGAYR